MSFLALFLGVYVLSDLSPRTILLAGPTATGKTALSVALAQRLSGEIVSADSMQVYRGFAIGTAQPTADDLQGVICHLIGCVAPEILWTVADWRREALDRIADIHARGKTAIVAGGTGLYFKALTQGLFDADAAAGSPELRRRLESEWDADAGVGLRERLAAVDPEASRRIHPNDRLRIVRALEVFERTGTALSDLQLRARRERRPLEAHRFVLTAPRSALYERIDRRVVEMVNRGFVEEVRGLTRQGLRDDWPAMKALGYMQMLRVVHGEQSLEDAVSETQRLNRRYAKQQTVLLRQWPGSVWLDALESPEKTLHAAEICLEFPPFRGF